VSDRPRRLAFVAGTGTAVGKTWIACRTLAILRAQGVRVAARKPVQSFSSEETGATDADLLAAATGERPEEVCAPHRWYDKPMAPPMAASALGRASFTIRDLAEELTWPPAVDVGAVEGAGGARSPLAADGDCVDLVRAIGPDVVVVVAHPGLGVINAVRLTTDAFRGHEVLVALNMFDGDEELHVHNRMWLAERDGFDVATDAEAVASRLTR
jgi:dethiobiotin synthetase